MLKIYLWAKKIHRALVVIISALSAVMVFTGLSLKYYGSSQNAGFDMQALGRLHGEMSVWFSVSLAIMAVTGLVLYVFPWYSRRQSKLKQSKEKDDENRS
jgi:hypothetical protein